MKRMWNEWHHMSIQYKCITGWERKRDVRTKRKKQNSQFSAYEVSWCEQVCVGSIGRLTLLCWILYIFVGVIAFAGIIELPLSSANDCNFSLLQKLRFERKEV